MQGPVAVLVAVAVAAAAAVAAEVDAAAEEDVEEDVEADVEAAGVRPSVADNWRFSNPPVIRILTILMQSVSRLHDPEFALHLICPLEMRSISMRHHLSGK